MIGALHGTVELIEGQTILLMVNGVGYELFTPHAAILKTESAVTLHTYLAVRETALDLYGFTTLEDKRCFELLLSVPKIGPKSALNVLQQADTSLLISCITTEDPSRLHKLSGIGKKTCENIVNNLTGKVDTLAINHTDTPPTKLSSLHTDAIDALVALGYDPKTARDKAIALAQESDSVSELVARALQE